jgi:hypothetical protein
VIGWRLESPVFFERWVRRFVTVRCFRFRYLRAFPADTTGQLDILGHDGDSLGVDGAQVGILKEPHQISLGCLLQGQHRGSLESQVALEVLGDLTDQTLEGQLADEEVGGLLVPTDLPEGDGTWAVTVGLLHTSGGRRGLTSGLGGQLLTRGLSSGGFTSGLEGYGRYKLVRNEYTHTERLFVVLLFPNPRRRS